MAGDVTAGSAQLSKEEAGGCRGRSGEEHGRGLGLGLPSPDGRTAGRTQVLEELAVGQHEEEALADGAGGLATAAEERRRLELLELARGGARSLPHDSFVTAQSRGVKSGQGHRKDAFGSGSRYVRARRLSR
jgi:hypothetical protein